MTSPLPERPNLEQLKNQTKTLLRAAQAKEPAALARFSASPAFAKKSATELAALSLALHDAQSVIAREHGFDSWNALREEVETLLASGFDPNVRDAEMDATALHRAAMEGWPDAVRLRRSRTAPRLRLATTNSTPSR